MTPLNEPLRILFDETEVPVTSLSTVYLVWRDDLLLDPYGDAPSAEAALADYRAAFPGDWQQLPSGTWYVPGRSTRLWVEPRAVLTLLPVIHADAATSGTNEAL